MQEKEEGETLMKAGKWIEARLHLEKSNRFLRIVLKHQPEDEAYLNVYGEQMIIFSAQPLGRGQWPETGPCL